MLTTLDYGQLGQAVNAVETFVPLSGPFGFVASLAHESPWDRGLAQQRCAYNCDFDVLSVPSLPRRDDFVRRVIEAQGEGAVDVQQVDAELCEGMWVIWQVAALEPLDVADLRPVAAESGLPLRPDLLMQAEDPLGHPGWEFVRLLAETLPTLAGLRLPNRPDESITEEYVFYPRAEGNLHFECRGRLAELVPLLALPGGEER